MRRVCSAVADFRRVDNKTIKLGRERGAWPKTRGYPESQKRAHVNNRFSPKKDCFSKAFIRAFACCKPLFGEAKSEEKTFVAWLLQKSKLLWLLPDFCTPEKTQNISFKPCDAFFHFFAFLERMRYVFLSSPHPTSLCAFYQLRRICTKGGRGEKPYAHES